MAEVSTTEVDATRLQSVLFDLQDALGQSGKPADISEIVRDETRRLIVEIVKDTPPQTKAIGEAAVVRDINSLFSGAEPGLIDAVVSEHGAYNVDTYITNKSGDKVHLKWDRIDPTGEQMARLHNAARNNRGGINRGKKVQDAWAARVVVPNDSKAAYMKEIVSHVGRWKASWADTAMALGVQNIVSWIKRHVGGGKSNAGFHKLDGLMDGSFPVVTFGSRAPGVGRQAGVIQSAIRIRSQAIVRRTKLIVSGYAKDIAQGMKIQNKAARSGQGGRYSIS
jgi:hypothetical protein